MRPPITYYGGKQKMLKYILPLIPQHEIYCEAFMGGGAVFFAKEPSKAEIINDINGNVSNFYRVVQSDFDSLKKLINGTLHSRGTYKEALAIYKNHAINVVNNNSALNTSKENPLRGWAFWVLTNDGFSGKIGSWAMERKSNKTGKTLFNKRESFCKEYAKRLDKVSVENRDALEIIKQYDSPETFFYLDPPYIDSDCGHYKGYTKADYTKLLEALTTLQGKFLLSSYPSEILNQYAEKQNWHRNEIKQKTRVTHRSKKIKTEVLLWNYDVENSGTAALLQVNTGSWSKEEENSHPEGVHYLADTCKKNLPIVIKYSGTKILRHPKRVSCFAAKPKFITMQNKEAFILENCYRSMLRGISSYKSTIARDYLSEKKLSPEKTFAGFGSGQIHHRKKQTFIDGLLSVGFLKPSKAPTNNSKIGYSSFGHCAITFPLRNEENSIVNFYAIGIKKPQNGYLNEIGIYPSYPPASTKKLFLVNSILDAATILEADLLNKGEAVMALREGKITAEHLTAISALNHLQEIILIENGCANVPMTDVQMN